MIGLENVVNSFIQYGANGQRGVRCAGNRVKGFSSSCALIDMNSTTGNETALLERNAYDTAVPVAGVVADIPAVTAAAALPLVGDSRVYQVTGNTNITSVNGGWNLKLAGNLVATADDSVTIVYDGANWYEKSRSVN
jgi:hypothetical protein